MKSCTVTQNRNPAQKMLCILLTVVLLVLQVTALPIGFTAEAEGTTSISYDPNDGMITYGHTGPVGARAELDTDNVNRSDKQRINFPSDIVKFFPDYDANDPYYDHGPVFNKALELARECSGEIFCEEGVYYFATPIYFWGFHVRINGVYGKTIFVADPYFYQSDGVTPVDVNGFITNANLSNTYGWVESCGMSDLTFVAAGAHPTFKPTSTAEEIMANIFSDDIQPIDNFCGMYRICTKYSGLNNLTFSGFESHLRWVRLDMLTRTENCSFGPSEIVINGVETNDAFINDCRFYGGYYTDEDGYDMLPTFCINFSMVQPMYPTAT